MFSQQYIIVGLQLELNLSSSFAITATGGLSCNQIVYYTTRTLKTFFEDMSRDTDPYFKLAVYVSMGMKYKFLKSSNFIDMSVKLTLYSALKVIGVFLIISLIFRCPVSPG